MMTGIRTNRTNLFASFHSFLLRLFQGQSRKKDDYTLVGNGNKDDEILFKIKTLKEELHEISLERKKIEETVINCDWYSVINQTAATKKEIHQFEAKELGDVPSLMVLKDDLLRRHELRLKKVESEAIKLIGDIRELLSSHQLSQAKSVFHELNYIIGEVESKEIREAFKEAILQWNIERKKIETEVIRKEAIQNKKSHEEEDTVNTHYTDSSENETNMEDHSMQSRYDDLMERIRRNQSEEEQILKALANVDQSMKKSYKAIDSKLKKAEIKYLYHYTDKRNLASINKHGGVLSMKFIIDHDLEVPAVIGDMITHNIDKDLHIDDYVKLLSFIDYKAINKLKENRDMVVLKIDSSVSLFKDSLFATKTLFDEELQLTDDYRILGGDMGQITFLVKTFIPKKLIVEVINC